MEAPGGLLSGYFRERPEGDDSWLGYDPVLQRPVLIRRLPESITRPRAFRVYRHAFRCAARLSHPSVAASYDLLFEENRCELVTEWVPWPTIRVDAPPPLRPLIEQLAHTLDFAHQHGVLHKAVSPGFIRWSPEGELKVEGFGTGFLEIQHHSSSWLDAYSYMSPEQSRGERVDRRTDIFSLGVLLYRIIGGALPFDGENLPFLIDQVLHREPDPLNGNADDQIVEAVHRCLEKDPNDRFQNLIDFLQACYE